MAEYDPASGSLTLRWPGEDWHQSLGDFSEGSRSILYTATQATEPDPACSLGVLGHYLGGGSETEFDQWLASARDGAPDWVRFGLLFANPSPHAPGARRAHVSRK